MNIEERVRPGDWLESVLWVLSHCWLGHSKDIRPVKQPVPHLHRFFLAQVDEESQGGTG